MRSRRLVALVLALLVVLTTGALGAGSATAGTAVTQIRNDRQYPLSVEGVYFDRIGPGPKYRPGPEVVGFAGQLTYVGKGLPDQRLTFERRLVGKDTWVPIASATTDEEGWAHFHTRVVGNADYRFTYAGDETHYGSTGAAMHFHAMRDLNAIQVKKDGVPSLQGDINPGWGNKYFRAKLAGTNAFVTSTGAILRTTTLPGRDGHRAGLG